MDSRPRRRSRGNTVTVQNNTNPPSYIPRAALILSLIAVIIAIVTQFTRGSIPVRTIQDDPPAANITSISGLIRAVFDAPQRGHFFRTGCLSSRSLLCHTLQDISFVLDAIDVLDEGQSYVFRITKDELHAMRRHILLRRERVDGCTPWQHGSFFMKLDWFLLYHLPRSIATNVFGTSATHGGFRRDRWGWCAETLPFGWNRKDPTSFERSHQSREQESTMDAPVDDFSISTTANDVKNDHESDSVLRNSPKTVPEQGKSYRDNPINQEAHRQQNIMYAR